jgi:hypothetical protein
MVKADNMHTVSTNLPLKMESFFSDKRRFITLEALKWNLTP